MATDLTINKLVPENLNEECTLLIKFENENFFFFESYIPWRLLTIYTISIANSLDEMMLLNCAHEYELCDTVLVSNSKFMQLLATLAITTRSSVNH